MSRDDDLGAFLRSEVPVPGPGHFEQIDARMAEIDAEIGEPLLDDHATPEISSVDTQTDDSVIRLTDMRHPETYPTPRRALLPLLAAAAVVAIAATAGIIALNRNNAVVQLDAADSGPEQTIDDSAAGETGGSDATPDPGNDRGEVPSLAVEVAEAEDRVWLEMQAFREQPTTWYPADLLEKVADPLPNTEPTSTLYAGAEPIGPDLTPGSVFGVSETVQPGDVLSSTGIRVLADDVEWVLIDSEIPFWIADESVIDIGEDGIEGFDRRQCFGNAESLLIMDFSADALTFTARFDYLDSILLVSGRRSNTADPLFTVETSAIGSGEEVPGGIIEGESWEGTDDGIIAGDRGSLPLIACGTVADEVAGLEGFIPDELLLPIPN